ncbi:MAG TPA: carboxypeptidase regulatory-like domain-containing protein [Phycicoccus sp.]|nr:carboxypeptidase regulatory-like domain-containing protein [Phycicoccus sp.]
MTPTPEHELRLAAEPLDTLDATILEAVREVHEAVDPVPADLLDRIAFAMSVASLEAEVAEIVSESALATVRGTDYDRADTVTFASEGLSVMVTIEHSGATRADIAGWASVGDLEVELRERSRTRTTVADEDGRFTFAGVERGLVNFVLRRRTGDALAPIITPAIEI